MNRDEFQQMELQRRIAVESFAAVLAADADKHQLITHARNAADRIQATNPDITADAFASLILLALAGPAKNDISRVCAADLQRYVWGCFDLLQRDLPTRETAIPDTAAELLDD